MEKHIYVGMCNESQHLHLLCHPVAVLFGTEQIIGQAILFLKYGIIMLVFIELNS